LFSPGTLVSSSNKTDPYDINEILLKVALNMIKTLALSMKPKFEYFSNVFLSFVLMVLQ
jgi:hypothetical protein